MEGIGIVGGVGGREAPFPKPESYLIGKTDKLGLVKCASCYHDFYNGKVH